MDAVDVPVQVGERTVYGALGERLLDVLFRGGVLVPAACVGQGLCGLCQVQILAGGAALSPATLQEARLRLDALAAEGAVRLACQARLGGPVRLQILGLPASPPPSGGG